MKFVEDKVNICVEINRYLSEYFFWISLIIVVIQDIIEYCWILNYLMLLWELFELFNVLVRVDILTSECLKLNFA